MDDLDAMSKPGQVTRLDPVAAIAGGEIAVEYEAAPSEGTREIGIQFDGSDGHITAAGKTRALVVVPEINTDAPVNVSTIVDGEVIPSLQRLVVGKKLAGGLHPVANPAFDPRDGSLYVTRSGSRGEHVPTSIFRVTPDGTLEKYSGDIMNPTSIAFDRTNRMFVTSRFDGTVYRITPEREMIAFADDMGIATGLAFNRNGDMFVGDRTGTIYRVNEIGEAKPWAQHEPSVSAYHLTFGPDDNLYVTGPTVSSFDAITRFDDDGNPTMFYQGLGRPQGLAFDRNGNLYVAASLRGRRGVVRISHNGSDAEIVVAAMNLVGLAFGPGGEMVVATNEAIYSLPRAAYDSLD
jgi:sugar lactone lactonase YvrE